MRMGKRRTEPRMRTLRSDWITLLLRSWKYRGSSAHRNKRTDVRAWRGPAIRSTGCSSRGPRLRSSSHMAAHNCLKLQDLTPSYRHICKQNTNIHKLKIKNKKTAQLDCHQGSVRVRNQPNARPTANSKKAPEARLICSTWLLNSWGLRVKVAMQAQQALSTSNDSCNRRKQRPEETWAPRSWSATMARWKPRSRKWKNINLKGRKPTWLELVGIAGGNIGNENHLGFKQF